jgi:hypothetical protein
MTLRLALAGAVLALALTSASAAKADLLPGLLGGNCGSTSKVFAPWGDLGSYYYASNGGFEAGGAGWDLGRNAQIVAENEPFYVRGAGDRYSLAIPAGTTVTTPSICYGTLYPTSRLFARSTTGQDGSIRVRVKVRSLLGLLTVLDLGTLPVGTEWSPTPVHLQLGAALAALVGSKTMQVQFIPSTGVLIDDLYVDPLLSKS